MISNFKTLYNEILEYPLSLNLQKLLRNYYSEEILNFEELAQHFNTYNRIILQTTYKFEETKNHWNVIHLRQARHV